MVWLLEVKLLNPLYKLLVQQKRVLQLMYFSESRAHTVPLFAPSKSPPLNTLYLETVPSNNVQPLMFNLLPPTKK